MVLNSIRYLLWGLLAIGLYGAVKVSYSTWTGASPCPAVSGFYICYVILGAYLMMTLAQFTKPYNVLMFYPSWACVFGLALLGTFLETSQGNVCPQSSSGIPLCYVSLFVSAVIGILFWILVRKKNDQ